jgi:hypothetical protein
MISQFAFMAGAGAVGVADGATDGHGVGVADAVGADVGVGVADPVGTGVGVADGAGDAAGTGAGDAAGAGDAVGADVAVKAASWAAEVRAAGAEPGRAPAGAAQGPAWPAEVLEALRTLPMRGTMTMASPAATTTARRRAIIGPGCARGRSP